MALGADARALMARVNKKYGDGSLLLASQMPTVPRFTSGSLSLDVILGGGWPGNQWVEIVGSESSGKTSVVHKAVAANQDADPEFTTLWIAAEGYDHLWAKTLGVDTERVIVHSTNAMEEAYSVMLQAAESRAVDMIVLDSYPALIPNDEDTKEMDEFTISAGARVTGKFFRKTGKSTMRSMVEVERPLLGVVINQWRDHVGAFSPHGTPKITPGGKAKNYAFYVRLEVSRVEWIDEKRPPKGTARVGQTIRLKTIKNKSAAPQQVASVDFYFSDAPNLGFHAGEYDTVGEMARLAILHDAVRTAGAWLYFGDEKWNGLPNFKADLRENLDLRDAVQRAVRSITAGKTAT